MSLGDMISERKNGMISELIDFQSITFKNYVGNEYVFTVVFIDFTIEMTIDISLNVVTSYTLVDGTLPIDSNDLLYYLNTIVGIETLTNALDTKILDFMTIMQNINSDVTLYSNIIGNIIVDPLKTAILNAGTNAISALESKTISTQNALLCSAIENRFHTLNVSTGLPSSNVEYNATTNTITIPRGSVGSSGNNGLTPIIEFIYNSSTGNLEYNVVGYDSISEASSQEW